MRALMLVHVTSPDLDDDDIEIRRDAQQEAIDGLLSVDIEQVIQEVLGRYFLADPVGVTVLDVRTTKKGSLGRVP